MFVMDIFSGVRNWIELLFYFPNSNQFLVIVFHRLSLPQQIKSVWVLQFQLNTFWTESCVSCQMLMGCICSRYLTLALVLSLFLSLLLSLLIMNMVFPLFFQHRNKVLPPSNSLCLLQFLCSLAKYVQWLRLLSSSTHPTPP